jgi:hypothetical protein
MSRWSEFEAGSRPWLRRVALLTAWAAPIFILTQEPAFRGGLSPDAQRAPVIATLAGLVLMGVLLVAVRRGRIHRESLFLPALLPILAGTVRSITIAAPELGQTFGGVFRALADDRMLRSGLVIDGFREGMLLIAVALTALASNVHAPTGPRALAVAFGLRASVPLVAAAAVLNWRVIYGAEQVVVLLPALLGVVALAELVATRGRESALVFGVALAAALLAAAAGPIDHGVVQNELPAATLVLTGKVLVRYVPALLLAFVLVFALRVDREKTLASLSVALVPPLVACALSFVFFGAARDWARAPGSRWLSSLPPGFELMQGPASDLPPDERIDRLLLIGDSALSRGGKALGGAQELDTKAGCDKLVERLALTPGEQLVFAADRRVPLARLDCLLGALTRAVQARRERLDDKGASALCTAQEIRFDAEAVAVSRAFIRLYGGGCHDGLHGLTVVGRGWSASTVPESLREDAEDWHGVRCPRRPTNLGYDSNEVIPLAMTRQVPPADGRERLVCGFAPSLPSEAVGPPSPPSEPSPFASLSVTGSVLGTEDKSVKAAFVSAVRSCYSPSSTWPKQMLEGWLAVTNAAQPEMWHVTTTVEDESAAGCIRGVALDFARKLAAGGRRDEPLMFSYWARALRLSIALTTTGVKSNAWVPQAVQDRLPALRACYEPQLRANPRLFDTLTFTLDLDSRHRIVAARSQQPKEMARIAYCIAPLLQGLETRPLPSMGDTRSASFNIEMAWDWD